MISLPDINQVYLVFRAKLLHLDFAHGEESLEARLFSEAEIPWQDMPSAPSSTPWSATTPTARRDIWLPRGADIPQAR